MKILVLPYNRVHIYEKGDLLHFVAYIGSLLGKIPYNRVIVSQMCPKIGSLIS